MKSLIQLLLLFSIAFFNSCQQIKKADSAETPTIESANWAERLGYPKGKKVIMLHADDAGMCEEANLATQKYLLEGHIQSAAAMPPCEFFDEMIAWAKENPKQDIGLHLTLTSEWKTYRWPAVSPVKEVPGLIDEEGKLWRTVPEVVQHSNATEVEKEIRAQIEKSIALGYKPDHIDTHMGTLYAHPDFTKAYLKVAMEYGIPANVIDVSNPKVAEHYRAQGYPMTEEMIALMDEYTLPKIDFFTSAPNAKTYEEKVQSFKDLILGLEPGITEIIFHPSTPTENLKTITNSWQQRNWEAEMFTDPNMIQFFKEEGIVFTNWKEIMRRFEETSTNSLE